MNEVIRSLRERRSIRKFKPDMVPREKIEAIMETGLYAASGRGQQKPIVIAVTDKALRDRLSKANCEIGGWEAGFDPFYGAPVVLIVLAPRDWPTYIYDGSLLMGQLMQAAHAEGLGSCWIHRAKEEFELDIGREILKKLGLEGDYEGIGHCVIGYPVEIPEAAPRKEGRVYWLTGEE
ncbi:nitroreductase [Selenomonas sp. KH1T6]|uniref:nitroreductase n=1 Tax=Selenomonas sp. KH1T6 TaxID=3158784 RepID=UPI0008A7B0FF|nr:hypothetical protein SAMN05216583_1274 [Selenomonas ruminantium]